MQKNHTEVWEKCLRNIRLNVNNQSYKTWFEPIRPVRLDEKVFTLLVPNKFFYEWLEEHYIGLLKSTIRQEVGEKVRLEYQILVMIMQKIINPSQINLLKIRKHLIFQMQMILKIRLLFQV